MLETICWSLQQEAKGNGNDTARHAAPRQPKCAKMQHARQQRYPRAVRRRNKRKLRPRPTSNGETVNLEYLRCWSIQWIHGTEILLPVHNFQEDRRTGKAEPAFPGHTTCKLKRFKQLTNPINPSWTASSRPHKRRQLNCPNPTD